MWMRSPAPILRVANTPRPADSVSKTRIGGGAGRPVPASLSAMLVVEKEEDARNSFVWEYNVLNPETQRLLRPKAKADIFPNAREHLIIIRVSLSWSFFFFFEKI